MKTINFILFASLISCAKNPTPTTDIKGIWLTEETYYNFADELVVTTDGVSENYKYSVCNDTIYLDYGLPFKIELLTDQELVLSKNDGMNFYLYKFDRIDG